MIHYTATQKKFSGLGVRPCLVYVFRVAESESEVHFTSSRQVFDITSKSLHSHTKIKNNSRLEVRSFLLYAFGVAETESVLHFTPSCQGFDITLKNLIIQSQLAVCT